MNSFSRKRSVQSLVKEINKNKIILDFSIQRKAGQWNRKKKSLLILSAIQEIIIPNIFVEEREEEDNKQWLVLDGKQRLSTLAEFLNDEFALDKSYPPELGNKKFSQLDEDIQDKIQDAEITVNVYRDITETEREDIFLRLNNGQHLSASNVYRVLMGPKMREFVDEAKDRPFMDKVKFTRGQDRISYEESILVEAVMLICGEGRTDFTKKAIKAFLEEHREGMEQDTFDEVLDALDLLDEIIPDKHKNLKPISVPMLIHTAILCLNDEEKKHNFQKNLLEFLDDYENRTDYLQYCQQGTSSSVKVSGRYNYFNRMVNADFSK